ncbi:MAG TPA: tetratricopeptide repeat protein [Methylomirabilota bacterium]|nr:tetratricopeptide repeat protein [Methylomirabilota bacterium]
MSRRPDERPEPRDPWAERLRALAHGELGEAEAAAVRQRLADDPVLAEHYLDLLDDISEDAEDDDVIAADPVGPALTALVARAQAEAREELVDAIAERLADVAGAARVALIGGAAADRAEILERVDRRVVGLGRATLRLDAARDPFVSPLAARRVVLLDDALAAPLLDDLVRLAPVPVLIAADETTWTASTASAPGESLVARTFRLGAATGHAPAPRSRDLEHEARAALESGDARGIVAALQRLARRGRPGRARALIRGAGPRIVSLLDNRLAGALAWARLLRVLGEPALASLALDRATPGDDALVHRERALLLADGGDLAAACRVLEATATAVPALDTLAALEARRGNRQAAVAALTRALEIAPYYSALHLRLARVLAGDRDWDRAVQAFERALHLVPGATGVLTEWARALVADGRLGEAAAMLGRAIAVEPWNVAHRLALARLDVERGALDEAEAAGRAALALAPDEPDAMHALALVEAARQHWEPATTTAQAALGREPSSEGHRVLARIAEGRDQLAAALGHLRNALALDPWRDDLRRKWRELLARVGTTFAFAPTGPTMGVAAPALAAAPSRRGGRWIMHEQGDARVLLSESAGGELIASVESGGRPVEGVAVTILESTGPERYEERATGATDEHGEAMLGLAALFGGLLGGSSGATWRIQVTLPPVGSSGD